MIKEFFGGWIASLKNYNNDLAQSDLCCSENILMTKEELKNNKNFYNLLKNKNNNDIINKTIIIDESSTNDVTPEGEVKLGDILYATYDEEAHSIYNMNYSIIHNNETYEITCSKEKDNIMMLASITYNGETVSNFGPEEFFITIGQIKVNFEPGSFLVLTELFNNGVLVAPICFMKDTIVKTDQGDLKIQDINPILNTINREKIITISKTIHPDEYLVKLNKDDISQDVPDKLTIVSPQHKILYNNKLTPVMDLPMVKYPGKNMIKNNNDTLYNILTENYSTYIANNMVSETLDPENRTSLIYQCLQKASIKETNETLTKYNEFNMNIHKNRELNKLNCK